MKKHKLYVLTFLAVSFVIILSGFFSFRYLYVSAREKLLESKLEIGKRESREIGKLLELQLMDGISKEKVIQNLQSSIANTDTQSGFICMYNSKGIELCHPNSALIGTKIDVSNSSFISENKVHTSFLNILNSGKNSSGIRNFPENIKRSSEIVSVYPIKGSDWLLASHTNIQILETQISTLYQKFLLVFLLFNLLVLGLCFFLIRMIYNQYEKRKREEINHLNNEIVSLNALNNQLKFLQEKYLESTNIDDSHSVRKRIITYHKDELVSLETSEIAYFVLDENIVYIQLFSGDRYTINSSLDELTKTLDSKEFYRANRQFIIHIKAIDSILLYGNNQLKLVVKPQNEERIIISKNKVADFKKWIEQ